MAITIKYQTLFSLDVRHHFLLDLGERHYEALNTTDKLKQLQRYNVHDFLDIEPSVSCRQLIKDTQLILKKTNTGVLVGCKIDALNNQPFVDIPEDAKFTFQMSLKKQDFFNFTTLPLSFGSPFIYCFNNLNKTPGAFTNLSSPPQTFAAGSAYSTGTVVLNDTGDVLSIVNKNTNNATLADLTKDTPALAYDNSETYKKGDIVMVTASGTDQLFTAKIDEPTDAPSDTPDNDWQKLFDLPLNYVNDNDLSTVIKPIYNYSLSSDSIVATAVLSIQTPSGFKAVQTDEISGTTIYQFDWRKIPSGFYQLSVTDDNLPASDPDKVISKISFYLNNGELKSPSFGIIELYATKADDDDFALLKANGSFPPEGPKFVLRFKNRSTIWRYLFTENQAINIGDDVEVENTDSKTLVTKVIHPLTLNGLITIKQGSKNLPNPNTAMIKPSTNNIYSEIHL